ncbi:glycosyltransferase family 2 protein [Pseudogemmatithrix spongiicola]|uniref:Glycosyltransferase family 2 protein n=1 Tax=Pseudogemmatithrix spongiicola TaxID=3062599 RepID=A0AA49K014_9BACT|nr:glycosyltransferase family 2 protein [Gemmatimonadaceae bacterium 'strain 138']WKW15385.1 glycosyltransferase family 2 protein [Gemmatimonadaceae bacterium 'strain 318']
MSQPSDSSPRFTVIIPTKDRADYLAQTLRTCAMQEYDNLHVVVADDGSTDHTRDVVEDAARRDPRIRYASQGRNVGMLENFEFALRQAEPGYVLALGGDDGLLPRAIEGMHERLRASGQGLLAWSVPIFFYAGSRAPTGLLVLQLEGTRLAHQDREIDATEFLARQARELHYAADNESPMIYVKGVASTTLIDRVRARTPGGRFWSCSTPDGYSGIVLAGEVERYAFSGTPFTLHGVSPSSQGLNYQTAGEKAKQQSEAFFRSAAGRPMHPWLASQPYSPLLALMTADFLKTAQDLPGWPGRVPPIDIWKVLTQSVAEMQDGQFAVERMGRELGILLAIAEHHGLGARFRAHVAKQRKNRRKPLEGNALSPRRLYLDAALLGARTVYDAAHATHTLHAMSAGIGLGTLGGALMNSLRYRTLSFRPGDAFPPVAEWRVEN